MDNSQPDGGSLRHTNPATQAGFTIIPNVILTARRLSPGSRLLYGLLKMYAWQTGTSYPGQQRLAEEMGVSTRQIRNYQTELTTAGLLRVEQRGLTQTNRYWIEDIPGDFLSDRKYPSGQEVAITSGQDRKPVSDKEDADQEDSVTRESAPAPATGDISLHPPNSNGHTSNGSSPGRHMNARPVLAADETPPPVVVKVPPGTPVNRRPDAPEMRPVPKPDPASKQLAKWFPPDDFTDWYTEVCAARKREPTSINLIAELQKFRVHPSTTALTPGQWDAHWQMWILRAFDGMGQPRGTAAGPAPPRRRNVDEVL